MIALGGALYIPIALALTRALDASGRRVMLAELIREFATLLRRMADFYRPGADEGAACLEVVEQQASFSDHLQAARGLAVHTSDPDSGVRLIAALAVLLEAFDGMIATMADHAPLRLAGAHSAPRRARRDPAAPSGRRSRRAVARPARRRPRPNFPDHAPRWRRWRRGIARLEPQGDPACCAPRA